MSLDGGGRRGLAHPDPREEVVVLFSATGQTRRGVAPAVDATVLAAGLVLLAIATIPFDAGAGLDPDLGLAKAAWGLAGLGAAASLVLGERRVVPRGALLGELLYVSYFTCTFLWSLAPDPTLDRIITLQLLFLLSVVVIWLGTRGQLWLRGIAAAYVVGAMVAALAILLQRVRGVPAPPWSPLRLTAFNVDPNELACSLAIAVALLPACFAGRASRPFLRLATIAPVTLILGTAALSTGSRAGTVGLGIAALVTGSQLVPKLSPAHRIAAALTVVGALWVFSLLAVDPTTLARLGLIHPMQASYVPSIRAQVWRDAWHVFGERPLFGVGLGSFAWVRHRWYGNVARPAHSVFVGALVEGGVLGALLLVIMLGAALYGAARAPRGVRVPLLAAWAAWFAAASTLSWEFSKVTWLLLGLSAAAGAMRRNAHLANKLAGSDPPTADSAA